MPFRQSRSGTLCTDAARVSAAAVVFLVASAAFYPGRAVEGPPLLVEPDERNYDIPAGPVNLAIATFATTSGVDILYDQNLGENRHSTAVIGHFSPQRAILLLLEHTGLVCHFTGPNAAVIFRADKPDTEAALIAPGRASLDLGPMRVTAPPLIGVPENAAFRAYGQRAQTEIYQRLLSDPQINSVAFRIEIKVRLDNRGRIENAVFIQASGDATLDARILATLTTAPLRQPPPLNMPMPLRFMIVMGNG